MGSCKIVAATELSTHALTIMPNDLTSRVNELPTLGFNHCVFCLLNLRTDSIGESTRLMCED